ncbi:response regulator [bacterium]|nr:response regulator [bacterium]
MNRRILFVDEDQNVLEGLRDMMHGMRHDWDMVFANSGFEALAILKQMSVDVVVTAMRMQEMNGAEFLDEVMNRYPKTIRIILAVHFDKISMMRSMGIAHQYLSRPCDAEKLKAAITQAFTIRNLLANDKLRRLVSSMRSLPSMPTLYLRLMEELSSPDYKLIRVGEIISKDVGMTAKLLQLVNSAFFGLKVHVSNPIYAARLLGPEIIKGLIFSVEVFSKFKKLQGSGLSLEDFMDHSMAVASVAKAIAISEKQEPKEVDGTFIAGMLHDIGKLVLAENLPERYRETLELVKKEGISVWEAEQEIFGATHAEVGAYLLGLWGLPESTIKAAAFHHSPKMASDEVYDSLTAVHVANALETELEEESEEISLGLVDEPYLETIDITERLPAWRELFRTVRQETKPG